ncbi:bifunctional histidinol-phosphatase/imidazoleglycerol-phosphate dehydratase HisB [soil metagenome]
MKKVLFIDRDGTVILEPEDEQIDSLEKLAFYPGAITALAKIAKVLDFDLVMVSNQDGLGTASFPENTFWPAHNKMMKLLEGEGIFFKEVLIDHSLPNENKDTRKPGTGMLKHYMNDDFDLANSYVIGDRSTDIKLAENLGCKAIFIGENNNGATLSTKNWTEIYNFLCKPNRQAVVKRKTNETEIEIEINLDGTGKYEIKTGLSFFDHMLDQLSRHSGCDLTINVTGDLHIDEHHTIEDTALALGEAFYTALGDKRGIDRYGFLLPMDDALAQVAIDFSGRNWLVWDAKFKREKIGDMPTEMFYHFFKSFCDTAKCNLNIKVEGDNEHHMIESVFKAVGKSIKAAVKKDISDNRIPSTKGIL